MKTLRWHYHNWRALVWLRRALDRQTIRYGGFGWSSGENFLRSPEWGHHVRHAKLRDAH